MPRALAAELIRLPISLGVLGKKHNSFPRQSLFFGHKKNEKRRNNSRRPLCAVPAMGVQERLCIPLLRWHLRMARAHSSRSRALSDILSAVNKTRASRCVWVARVPTRCMLAADRIQTVTLCARNQCRRYPRSCDLTAAMFFGNARDADGDDDAPGGRCLALRDNHHLPPHTFSRAFGSATTRFLRPLCDGARLYVDNPAFLI